MIGESVVTALNAQLRECMREEAMADEAYNKAQTEASKAVEAAKAAWKATCDAQARTQAAIDAMRLQEAVMRGEP